MWDAAVIFGLWVLFVTLMVFTGLELTRRPPE